MKIIRASMNTRLADVKLLLKAKLAKIFTKNPLILFMVQFDQSYALIHVGGGGFLYHREMIIYFSIININIYFST